MSPAKQQAHSFMDEKSEHPIIGFEVFAVTDFGSPEGIRTPDLRLERAMS